MDTPNELNRVQSFKETKNMIQDIFGHKPSEEEKMRKSKTESHIEKKKSEGEEYFKSEREVDDGDLLFGLDDIPYQKKLTRMKNWEDQEKFERMRHRDHRKFFMFYPEDQFKANWDLFVTIILIFTCLSTPYRIAFIERDNTAWTVINYSIDSMFLIDIIFIFNSAYNDEDFRIVDDRKKIAKNYLNSWFTIDFLAIVPFDLIL